jgi:hypothetical protein
LNKKEIAKLTQTKKYPKFLVNFFSHSAYCKIGVATDTLQTATLKCLVSQGMTNFLYGATFQQP